MEPINHLQTIELLKAAKPLFSDGEAYLVAAIAAIGTVAGVLAAFFPNRWMASTQQKILRKSTAFQLYAEIRATLEVERYRGYSTSLSELQNKFDSQKILSYSYQVHVPDERFIIYKANPAN